MTRRADALFELADALLCADGPVKTLVGLTLVPERRRGHGAMYDALNQGRIDVAALRRELAGLPLPRTGDVRLLQDLPVEILGRMRSDRVLRRATPAREHQPQGGRPAKHGGEFVFGDCATWGAEDAVTVTDTRR